MKLITKMKIENFRSFLGTTKDDLAEVVDIVDLNVFSGSNDSGKSNILRALNLFFNNEIHRGDPFLHDRDLNISKRNSGNRVVKIQLFFDISRDKDRDRFLPSNFSISKYYDKNGFRNYLYEFSLKNIGSAIKIDSREIENKEVYKFFLPDSFESLEGEEEKEKIKKKAMKRERNYRVKFAGFLNKSISYQYVPAIKDSNFLSHLYGRVLSKIRDNEKNHISKLEEEKKEIELRKYTIEKKGLKKEFIKNLKNKDRRNEKIKSIENEIQKTTKVKRSINDLENKMNDYSKELFVSIPFLDPQFKILEDLGSLFENFDIGTGFKKIISLSSRGDGIQAKFIPQVLNFIDTLQVDDKKYFLRGFEEPENSSEYKNQQELALKLKKTFSNDKQIFLTTHSAEFLSLYDGKDVAEDKRKANLYNVRKVEKKIKDEEHIPFSTIEKFNIDDNRFPFATVKGILEDELGISGLHAQYSKELQKIQENFFKEKKIQEQEKTELSKTIKQYNKPILFVEDKYMAPYKIAYLRIKNIDCNKDNFDDVFDQNAGFKILSKDGKLNLYKFIDQPIFDEVLGKNILALFDFDESFSDFNGLSASRWSNIQGTEETGLYRVRNDYQNIKSLILPIPSHRTSYASSVMGSESLFEIELYFSNDCLFELGNLGDKVLPGGHVIKIFRGSKKFFWKKLINLNVEEFNQFRSLFNKIEELLELI